MFENFWTLFPMGSRLNWNFIKLRLYNNIIYNIVFGSARLQFTLWFSFSHMIHRMTWELINDVNTSLYASRSQDITEQPWHCVVHAIIHLISFVIAAFSLATIYLTHVCICVLATIGLGVTLFGSSVTFMILLLWLLLYRIPIYDILYPIIRNWMLQQNSRVYQTLSYGYLNPNDTIRVLRISSGTTQSEISCELITKTLSEADFQALSYVWGTSLLPYKISVNEKPFYVTKNLYSALQELRKTKTAKFIWIDAICINQFDNAEKSVQVQLMQQIYSKASEVIVWLGAASNATVPTFSFIEKWISTSDRLRRSFIWMERESSEDWKLIRKEVTHILKHDWFRRIWIIQEVVVAKKVAVRRGSYQVEWEKLCSLFTCREFRDSFPSVTTTFIGSVQDLRVHYASAEVSTMNILELATKFRMQSASFGSDKIYALLGLLRDQSTWRIQPDYNKIPDEMFKDFAISSIKKTKNLTVVSLASGASLREVSWCRDWRLESDSLGPVSRFSSFLPTYRNYSAAGQCPPSFEVDALQRILHLQGFELDTISVIGAGRPSVNTDSQLWSGTLSVWEHAAGVSSNDADVRKKEAFNRTITADSFAEGPGDWRRKLRGWHSDAAHKNDEGYLSVVQNACWQRRFFITKGGRFGLGPWDTKKNDRIVVCLGSSVPFVIRLHKPRGQKVNRRNLGHEADRLPKPEFFKFLGEAFCDGAMYYDGDIQDDIQTGKLALREYSLL